jgi:hypothetical protein
MAEELEIDPALVRTPLATAEKAAIKIPGRRKVAYR